MDQVLRVTHTRDRFSHPLAIVRNLPGEGAKLTPHQMRLLGSALIEAASDCDVRPMDEKNFHAVEAEHPLETPAEPPAT